MKWLYLIIALILILYFLRGKVETFMYNNLCPKRVMPPKEKQIVVKLEKTRPSSDADQKIRKIPYIIMQTNEKDEVPKAMANAIESIKERNVDCDYFYFTDEDAKDYLAKHFEPRVLKAYKKVKPGAFKADLFRYCFLYKNGGIYIDTGMVCLRNLSDYIRHDDTFVSPEDNGTGGIFNAFICCTPGHPIVKKALDIALTNIEKNDYGNHPLDVTGPTVLGNAFRDVMQMDVIVTKTMGTVLGLIKYQRAELCTFSGIITDGISDILKTKYPGYYIDQMWYNTNKHYSDMWHDMDVFNKHIYQDKALMTLFEKFLAFSEGRKLNWWISDGTLLGAVRENGKIEWDDDIDICATSDTIEMLKNSSWELSTFGLKLGFSDYIWRISYLEGLNSLYIDVFEMRGKNGVWDYVEQGNKSRWSNSFFLQKELFPLADYSFGHLRVPGPANPYPYLERQYGDWETPVKMKSHH